MSLTLEERMHYQDQAINEALRASDDEGIIVMHRLRDYGVWMRCRNFRGELVGPTCFGRGYKSRHAAKKHFERCGGQALSVRSLILGR